MLAGVSDLARLAEDLRAGLLAASWWAGFVAGAVVAALALILWYTRRCDRCGR